MNITLSVLAHVDAGKTTFCEQLLHHANVIKLPGRVDRGNSFMDTHPLERERGITIFSSQASFHIGKDTYQLLDTPGHADFSGEMERALSVTDVCVLVVSCVEGIQPHTRTLWRLLERAGVPAMFFLNKTDRTGADADRLYQAIRECFSKDAADFRDRSAWEDWAEPVADREENVLEEYLAGTLTQERANEALSRLFLKRGIFPVLAGSALNDEGIGEVLTLLPVLMEQKRQKEASEQAPFSAICYQIRIDEKLGRLSYLRVLSGKLVPRMTLGEEKVTSLYTIQGERASVLDAAYPGMLCAVSGLTVRSGAEIGETGERYQPEIEPMLISAVTVHDGTAPSALLKALRTIEEEEPLLRVQWHEREQFASVSIMGAVQLEILERVLQNRFHISASFGECRVIYRETVASETMGVGHYEPLRHYAEVRVLLSPLPAGSGITFESRCHVDFLPAVWQKQIREILLKENHYGVQTGSVLTDTAIVLLNGRAHPKHTEGGDFYEAANRAVRNALMRGKSLLLEPYCRYSVQTPREFARPVLQQAAMLRGGPIESSHADVFTMEGESPVSTFLPFLTALPSLTRGQGSGWWENIGYRLCHNPKEVIAEIAYSPEADQEHSPDSVFCAHGAGFTVKWDHVEEWAHTAKTATY